jgi:transcriptional regulator with XRE-family HTH domain
MTSEALREPVRTQRLRAFGDRLRSVRRRLGYTQESLAEATGLSRSALAKLERGEREPRLITLLILVDGLEVSSAELLDELLDPRASRSEDPSIV